MEGTFVAEILFFGSREIFCCDTNLSLVYKDTTPSSIFSFQAPDTATFSSLLESKKCCLDTLFFFEVFTETLFQIRHFKNIYVLFELLCRAIYFYNFCRNILLRIFFSELEKNTFFANFFILTR